MMLRPARHAGGWCRAGLLLPVVLGVLVAVVVLASAGIAPASAQPASEMLPKEEAFRLSKWAQRLQPSQFTTPAQAQANQKLLTTAARSRVAGLGPHLIRGGLATAAAGVWIHNGVTLYNAVQCGATACPEVYLDAQFRKAETAGAGGFAVYRWDGQIRSKLTITKMEYSYNSATGTGTYTTDYIFEKVGSYGSPYFGSDPVFQKTISSGSADVYNHSISNPSTLGQQRFYVMDRVQAGQPTYNVKQFFGEPFDSGNGYSWKNPVYDWGDTSVVPSAPGGGYTATPEESRGLFGAIQDAVAAPEAPPDVTPETLPDYFPEEWEEEFPDVGEPGEQDDPYGDPDEDGQPNHADPDDDEDGIPDEEDDQPFGVPSELPSGDPDGDGVPNRDDQDDDGDSIPDEDDPQPFTPTDPGSLPQDHPYADPDEDGEPNRSDPDDDGDGIPDEDDPEPRTPTDPNTLPDDHPYADPDTDGSPNKDDGDDDGDGVPDTEDPAPHNPQEPKSAPNADPDGDGTPNKDDADDDGDGWPDTNDPAPHDPASPTGDPNADEDADGVPNKDDAAPDDKSQPSPEGDPDGDGVPNKDDPAPGDNSVPDKQADQDKDGVPDYQDPAPNDKAQPNPNGDPDGDGVPNSEDPDPGDPNNPPPAEGAGCPTPREVKFDIDAPELGSVFPFSLVVKSLDVMAELVSPSNHLSITAPGLGQIESTPAIDAAAATFRGIIGLVIGIGMGFWFYRYITGRGSE